MNIYDAIKFEISNLINAQIHTSTTRKGPEIAQMMTDDIIWTMMASHHRY